MVNNYNIQITNNSYYDEEEKTYYESYTLEMYNDGVEVFYMTHDDLYNLRSEINKHIKY